MVFVMIFALTGCLKKGVDEGVSMETSSLEESVSGAITEADQDLQAVQEKSVSVEPASSQAAEAEKPSPKDIQQALKNVNLYHGNIDGIIGPNTRKAIESFQSQNGLKVDGKVGAKTWQKLKEYLVISN